MNVTETEWDEMKTAKQHCRRIKHTYEVFILEPTNETTVQIPESLWNALEDMLKDNAIRTDLQKE